MRNHDKVRQNKDELEKIAMIEQELTGSVDLREVSKAQDVDEFEALTNREFNRNYEAALL